MRSCALSIIRLPGTPRCDYGARQLRTIQASPRVFCDETPMPVLDPGRRRTRICQFWAHAMDDRPWGGPSPPAVAYVFADSRGTDEIAGQLADFSGILQVDGYAAYKALARGHGGAIRLAFCLAHARRKFVAGVATPYLARAKRAKGAPSGGEAPFERLTPPGVSPPRK